MFRSVATLLFALVALATRADAQTAPANPEPPKAADSNAAANPVVASPPAQMPSQPASPASQPTGQAQAPVCWPELNHPEQFTSPSALLFKVVKVAPQSPVVNFASGPSHTEVIALPEFKKAYTITFRMVYQGRVLVPAAAVLDANFCVLQDKGELPFRAAAAFWSRSVNEESLIGVSSAAPRYIVVYTDARRLHAVVNLTRQTGLFTSHSTLGRADTGYFQFHLDP